MFDGWLSFLDILNEKAKKWPDCKIFTFLSSNGAEVRVLTYKDLLNHSLDLAVRIQQKTSPGQRVLLISQNQADFTISFLGCLIAGVIAVPAQTPKRNRKDLKLANIIDNSKPTLIIGDEETHDKSARINPELTRIKWLFAKVPSNPVSAFKPVRIGPEMPAMIQYTSGTLGQPKGVVLSHGNIMANSGFIQSAMRLGEQNSFVSWLPHYHDLGLFGSVLEPIISQVPAVFLSPLDFAKKPLNWLRAISKYKATISGAPNFGYQHCLDRIKPEDCLGLDLSSWKVAYCGADMIQATVLESFAKRFGNFGFNKTAFMPCYGMAEATLMMTCGPYADAIKTIKISGEGDHHEKEVVSCGLVNKGCTIQVVKDQRTANEYEVGEIWYKGNNVGLGYWSNESETESNFNHSLNGDEGFLRTGDLGFVANGELYLTGRLKEIIISRGRNFYPQDIEHIATGSDGSLAAGLSTAFAVEERNEEGLVILQEVKRAFWKKPDYSTVLREIFNVVNDQLELSPQTVALLQPGSLPRTSSGKISRLGAKRLYLAQKFDFLKIERFKPDRAPVASQPGSGISLSQVQEEIMSLVQSSVDATNAGMEADTSVFDLGIDSIAAVDLVAAIEEHFGIDLDASLLWQFDTIEEISWYIFENKLKVDDLGTLR
ncbi:MAG: AMP-binding protein [Roseivirga sp.]|nr:AMP-binding protein [Roseivirga sp.]